MTKPVLGETVGSLPQSPALTPTLPVSEGASAPTDDGLPDIAPARYQLANEIGRGGIGRVIKAHDTVLHRTIAIKELHAPDEATRRRFVREALITARLQHPSIVPVYEAGRRDGAPFYAMKLVAGRTLGDAIAGSARTLAARLGLVPSVLAVADAIAYAHGERIVHRDLKPQNVLLGAFGETVVIDWGLAKDLADNAGEVAADGPYRNGDRQLDRTVAGAVLGTPAYMSPEQADGMPVDERTDVYALGAMLYHVVTGSTPHHGDTIEAMLDTIRRGDIVALGAREPDAPADLATIVGTAMARDPAARYPSARELADDLRRFQTGQLVGAHRYSLGDRARRWIRRHRAVVAAAGVALVALVTLGVWSVQRILRERRAADAARALAVDKARSSAANNNRAVLAQARGAVDRDPAEALAWLAAFDPSGPGWEAARAIGLGALARPRPDRIMTALSRDAALYTDASGIAVVSSARAVWVGVLETQASASYAISPVTYPVVCDDHRHVVGFGRLGGLEVHYAIDVADWNVATEPATLRQSLERRAACNANTRFFADQDRVYVWDGGAARELGPTGHAFRGVYNTGDGRHAISQNGVGAVTRWSIDAPPATRDLPLAGREHMAWSADGRLVALAINAVATDLWDMETGVHREIAFGGSRLAIAPDGTWIAIAGGTEVRVFGTDGTARRRIGDAGKLDYLFPSRDGRWLVGGGTEITAWNVQTPVPQRLMGHTIAIASELAGPDQLVTMDVIGRIRRWPLAPPANVLPGVVVGSARSADGRWLVMATPTKVLRRHDNVTEEAGVHDRVTTEPVRQ